MSRNRKGNVVDLRTYDARHAGSIVESPIADIRHSSAEAFLCSFSALSTDVLPVLSPLLLDKSAGRRPSSLQYLTDPAIALKLISAGWARSGRPATLSNRHADYYLEILGTHYASNLVADSPPFSRGPHEAILRQVWGSYLKVGYLASQIMGLSDNSKERCRGAFFVGLCHDVGWLVQLMNSPRMASRMMSEIEKDSQKSTGTTHERLAQTLAYSWGLPSGYSEVLAYHHQVNLRRRWRPQDEANVVNTVCVAVRLGRANFDDLLGSLDTAQREWVQTHARPIRRAIEVGTEIGTLAQSDPELALQLVHGHVFSN